MKLVRNGDLLLKDKPIPISLRSTLTEVVTIIQLI